MSYVGDIRLGDTIDVKFATVSTIGAPTTLAGTPAVSAYPGNSTTQLTAGITLTVDFDAVTGLHNVRVVATSGNGYATATNYSLVITTGTVGGTSVVGYVVGEFSIENRLPLSVGSVTGAVGSVTGNVGGNVTGSVGSVATGGLTAASFAADSITAAKLAADVTTELQSGLATAANLATVAGYIDTEVAAIITTLGTPAGVSVSADIAAIKAETASVQTDTNDIQARLPAALTADGNIKADTLRIGGTLQTARDIGASVLLSAGTAAGQLDFTAGVVKANLAQILGTALTETAGQIAAAFKKFFDIATPAATMDHLVLVDTATTATNLTNAPTAGDFTATMKTSIGTAVAASAVASVTGSVGSVAAGGITASSIATGAVDADALASDAVNEIADAVLDRNMATGTDSGSPTVRTMRQALRASRNRVAIAAGTATVYKEDDATASWTAAVTTTAGNPVSEIDPASA